MKPGTWILTLAGGALLYVAAWPPLEVYYDTRNPARKPEGIRKFYSPAKAFVHRLDSEVVRDVMNAYYHACLRVMGGKPSSFAL